MKTVTLFIIITITLPITAQVFGEQNIITQSEANGARKVLSFDMDGDGYRDIISASTTDDKIAWYKNLNDNGNFGTQQIISVPEEGVSSIYIADIDSDGDQDVIAMSSINITWYENIDGNGNFGEQQEISTLVDGAISVHVNDFDGDGALDIASASWGDDKIAWYKNIDGNGSFGTQQIVSTTADGANFVYSVDIDGDGFVDILSSSLYDNKIAWYKNIDGNGNFGANQIITTSSEGPRAVMAVDIDGDGDQDVLSASQIDNKIAWYENTDGNGTFGYIYEISTTAIGAFDVYISDIDGDGDQDVLSASNSDDKIAWYENTDSLGTFGPQQIITTSAMGAISVYSSDIDGDGDQDVLFASGQDDKIAWYENTDGLGTFGAQQTLTISLGWIHSIYSSDIDGDGNQDILSGYHADNQVSWFKNMDGNGNFGPAQTITNLADKPQSIYTADIDGDGDQDVLSASTEDNKVAWYENMDGNGNFGAQKIISTSALSPQSVFAIDIDSDGDLDVLSASWADNKIAWYENTNGDGVFGPQQIISTDVDRAFVVYTTDIDNDNDNDVLSVSVWGDEIAWFENMDGNGNFGTKQIITTLADGAVSVYTADLDNDGDEDVLSASWADNKIAWYENMDGNGSFGEQQIITTSAEVAYSVYAIDIDGDGDNDVLSASRDDNKIAWYENMDGNGNFGSQHIISEDVRLALAVLANDFDGDGDNDVLCVSYGDDKILWFENLGGIGIEEYTNPDYIIGIYPNPTNKSISIQSNSNIEGVVFYNLLGKPIKYSYNKEIDLTDLINGVYFVKIVFDEGKSTTKKVIKR